MDQKLKEELTAIMVKLGPIIPPILLAAMTKLANNYRQGKKFSFLSTLVIVCLAASGAILGYWISMYLEWKEYKMTLTIYFFGLLSDKLFEFIFSKTFLNNVFNFVQDWFIDNIKFILNRKKDQQ